MIDPMPPTPGHLRPPLSAVPLPPAARPASHHHWRAFGMGCLYALLAALCAGIGTVTFASIYHTVTTLLRPSMHAWARGVPVAGEITFGFLFVSGVVLAIKRRAAGAWRPFAMALLVSLSLLLNVWAFRHSLAAAAGHLLIVVSFFVTLLGAKSFLMALAGGKVRGDGIPLGEWIAHPVHSARLWRWRQGWGEPSLGAARRRYLVLLYVTAVAHATLARDFRDREGRDMPRRGWRKRLPVTLRYELSTGLLPMAFALGRDDWQEAAGDHVESQLDLLPDVATPAAADGTGQAAIRGATPDAIVAASGDAADAPAGAPAIRRTGRQRDASERARASAAARRILTRNPATPLAEVVAKSGVSERTASRIKSQLAQAAGTTS